MILRNNPAGRKALSLLFKGRGAELGVESAKYSVEIMKTADFMYAIDIWSSYGEYRNHVSDSAYEAIYEKAKENLRGKNVEFMRAFTQEAAPLIPEDSLDWIYVDASHEYDYVLSDLRHYYPKVKSGGIIAGHDFTGNHKDVRRAVIDFCSEKGIDEITEWCGDRSHSFHFIKP